MAEGYCQVLRNRLCEGTCPRTTGEPSGPPPGMRSPSDVGACASRRSTDRCRVCPSLGHHGAPLGVGHVHPRRRHRIQSRPPTLRASVLPDWTRLIKGYRNKSQEKRQEIYLGHKKRGNLPEGAVQRRLR